MYSLYTLCILLFTHSVHYYYYYYYYITLPFFSLGYAIFAFIVVFTAATATWIFGIILAHESTENIKTSLLIAVCSSYIGASIFFYVSRNAWLKQQQQQALSQAPFQTMDTSSSSSCPTSSAGTAFSSLTQWVADDSTTTTDKHAYQPISSREEEEDFDL